MPAFVPVPWLNSSDQFLHAMIAGGQAGIERARLRQAMMNHGGGNFNAQFIPPGAGGLSELDKAHLGLLGAQTEAERAKAANETPWTIATGGQGEIMRVNRLTGESQLVSEARPRTAAPLGSNDVLTQAKNLLEIIGNPALGAARPAAIENYKTLQKQFPNLLSEYKEPAPIPPETVNNAGGGFGLGDLYNSVTMPHGPGYDWMRGIFGGTPAANTGAAGKYKIEEVQ